MKYYLEFKDEKSHKFWSVEVRDNKITVNFGKIGATGKPSTKEFDSVAEANKEARKQAKAKIKKGYVDKTLEYFTKSDNVPEDVVDSGEFESWHSEDYWDSWGVDMDMSIEGLRNPDKGEIKAPKDTRAGDEMPEEVVKGFEYDLVDYAREGKVERLVETINKLRNGNVNAERMQKVFDKSLKSAFGSQWNVSPEHLEVIRLLLEQGAVLAPRMEKHVLAASEDELTKIIDQEIRPDYSNHIAIQNIGIFKRYLAVGAKPEKFMECVDSYFEEIFAEAADVAERVLRAAVERVKSGGDPDRKYPIPAYKFTPDINGLRINITGEHILAYPDIYSSSSWAEEKFIKTDDLDSDIIAKYFTAPLTKTFNKLTEEGLFDDIANGKISLYLDDKKNELVSKILDVAEYEKVTREVMSKVEELERSDNWTENAEKLKDVLVPALNMRLETENNRLLKIVLANLYSGNPEAEEKAKELLRDYLKLSPRWDYEFVLYSYLNFDFDWAAGRMKGLADSGYEPARETYARWLSEGTFEPPKPKPVKYDGYDDITVDYTAEDMFIETDTIIARAGHDGHIRLRFKTEGEKGYSDALDFINNLTFKKYSKMHNGLQLSIYFLARPMSNYPTEAFFMKAAMYPALHEKLAFYVDTVMYDYDHYHDQDDEESTVIGTYAAKQLILADPKNLHLAIKLADATDGEHEMHVYYFTDDVIRRYGITPESIAAVYELSLTCDHRDPELPKEVYTNRENLDALINHVNLSDHHFKGGKFLRFIRGMFDSKYENALAKIKALYDAASDLELKNTYADFYNMALNFILDPKANYALRYAKEGDMENLGEPLQGVDKGMSASAAEELGDQSCVITHKEAEERGIPFNEDWYMDGKCMIVFCYSGETNADIVNFNIDNRNKVAHLDANATYPRYTIYSNEQAIFFDKKWVLDLNATAFRSGIVLYDGKKQPIVLYGICDFAEIMRGVGKKQLDPASLLQFRDKHLRFEASKGAFHIASQANQYICDAYESAYAECFNRAFMDIAKVKPKDGEDYTAAQVFKAALLRRKKDRKGIKTVYEGLMTSAPEYSSIWQRELDRL